MERSLITWSIPNMVTIWLMLIGLVIAYAVGAQIAMRAGWIKGGSGGSATAPVANDGGY